MRLAVQHTTTYRFDPPIRGVAQSIRLRPSQFEGQTVVNWRIEAPGATFGSEYRDGAGDLTGLVTMSGYVESLEIAVDGIVETQDLAGVLRGHRERVPPMTYFRETRVTACEAPIRAMVADALADGADRLPLETAHVLAGAVAEAVEYQPGRTDASTTAAEALASGAGVCQDHAHLLIAAAHAADLPARYVAGYLMSSAGDAAPYDEASHAWAEIHIEGLGWVGFDPSNKCCPDERYIRLCSGLDAADAAPIRGVRMGSGDEEMEVDVAVTQVQQ